MNYAHLAAFAVVLLAPGQSLAKDRAPIEIKAPRVTLSGWVSDVSKALDENLRYPLDSFPALPESGYASITFRVGADGSPVDVTLRRSTGNKRLDRAAMLAVAGMTNIGPLPATAGVARKVRANILFAADAVTLAELAREERRDMARLAATSEGRNEIALTTSAAPTAG
ncbi:energy transducer TonB [Novosphingobium sp. ZN18A2]|uniref:energy transducer TonB family protein n=1 Tax=Novosphingobium sp. ZN18A2 TaxID=3079861 RepID=UPI0030CAB908